MGVWVWALGALALLLGLLLTPYVPEACCPSDVGFIDVASIHQQDVLRLNSPYYSPKPKPETLKHKPLSPEPQT